MRVSPAGRLTIRQREGCRLTAYRDSRGLWTIGVGHLNMTPPVVTPGMCITEAEADALLAGDLAPVEATIARYVLVPLSQNECDALASLGFNIGCGGLAHSSVVTRLNKGDRAGAADAFMLWARPSSLTGRRRDERAQFLRPDPHAPAIAVESPRASKVEAPSASAKPLKAQPIVRAAPPSPAAPPAPKPDLAERIAAYFGRH